MKNASRILLREESSGDGSSGFIAIELSAQAPIRAPRIEWIEDQVATLRRVKFADKIRVSLARARGNPSAGLVSLLGAERMNCSWGVAGYPRRGGDERGGRSVCRRALKAAGKLPPTKPVRLR